MTPLEKVRSLPIWQGEVRAAPLGGGITNINFLVEDGLRRAWVRIGDDLPVHQIMRFHELAASRAAARAGVSPEVIYHEAGALVIDYIEGRTMTAADLRQDHLLDQALDLVATPYSPLLLASPFSSLFFLVFPVLRYSSNPLHDDEFRYLPLLPGLLAEAGELEVAVGPAELVFGHNDLLPANFLHDGTRMWLIDWDYAGFNSPFFDLGGLAANNGLSLAQEGRMLERYFDRSPDALMWRRYRAMKEAAALRETLWSMVSEIHSELAFDFAAYTATNLSTYRASFDAFKQS